MTAASSVRITGPASLIAAVPYLLGFEPNESLVLVGLRDGQVTVTARVDLDELDPRATADLMHRPRDQGPVHRRRGRHLRPAR